MSETPKRIESCLSWPVGCARAGFTASILCGLFLCALSAPVVAADLPSYTIYRAGTPIAIDGRLDEPAWTAAPDVGAFQFAWWTEGKQEQTVAKLLWDDDNLYVSFISEDAHIWADHIHRSVYLDDCVEVFTAPNPDRPQAYFNIEMNVLGFVGDDFHPEGPEVPVPEKWDGEGIRIATAVMGTLNDDSDTDQYWILEVAIPFQNFARVARNTPPQSGEVWHLDLNRTGGKTNIQHSQWSPSRTEEPQFHAPNDFGRVLFSEVVSPFWRR